MNIETAVPLFATRGARIFRVHGIVTPGMTEGEASCTCGKVGCNSPGKHPVNKGWQDAATTDIDAITSWLSRGEESCNYGVVLDGVDWTVVEVDPYAGGSLRGLRELVEELGLISVSGRGFHVWFKGTDLPNGTKLGPGMTVRATGYFVVGPGSMHYTGRRYGRRTYGFDRIDDRPDLVVVTSGSSSSLKAKGSAARVPRKIPEEILDGEQRWKHLLSLAGGMAYRGVGEASILEAVRAVNRNQCRPPKDDQDVVRLVRWVLEHDGETEGCDEEAENDGAFPGEKDERKSRSTVLVELALEAGIDLFHDPDQVPYAVVPVGTHRETWKLGTKSSRRWLTGLYYQARGKAVGSHPVQDALAVLEAKAIFEGPEEHVFVRVADLDGAIYLDLGDENWSAVEITREGWSVVAEPPVRFRRPKGMQALPRPVVGGSLEDLRECVNISDPDWPLWLGGIVGAFHPSGPYVVMNVQGEQGSAKTSACKVFRLLVDPSTTPVRTSPRSERDLMISATSSWIMVFDNLSSLPDWLSDGLCRLATGGGLATRELYSDDEQVLFAAKRPILMNGISEVATRGDLLDRSIIITTPPITEHVNERDFWTRFENARPGILGALCDAVSTALRRHDDVPREGLPRMADFCRWVIAAEPALPIPEGSFLAAYEANRASVNTLALEAAPVAPILQTFMGARETFEGTASDLLTELDRLVPEHIKRERSWPKSARGLSSALRRVTPNLRRAGIWVTPPGPNDHTRVWEVTNAPLDRGSKRPPEPPEPPEPDSGLRELLGGLG